MLGIEYLLGFVALVYAIALAVGLYKKLRRSAKSQATKTPRRAAERAVREQAPADRLRNAVASIDMLDHLVKENGRDVAPPADADSDGRVLPLRGRLRR